MTRRPVPIVVLAGLVAVVLAAVPLLAADPESSDVTVPTTPGDTVEVEYSGTVPPGANDSSECAAGPLSDLHTVEVAVPAGAYDAVAVRATATISYSGPTSDLIVTVVRPDGSSVSGDSGFVDADEAVSFADPQAGTYQILACAFAAATPQPYTGTLVLEARERDGGGTGGGDDEPGEARPSVSCVAPAEDLEFDMGYIDESRAGGEPLVATHPDGTLLWGSHAGTTHFFGPAAPDPATAAFLENYEGQTYQYFSEDNGETWDFVPRTPINADPLSGLPNSGFSDPEFAIDEAGNVFISEINLANVAVSKSTDSGRTYTLQNLLGLTISDRQWMEADEEDVLYITANGFGGGTFPGAPVGELGHFMAKSTDGGVTFGDPENPNPNGVADVRIDRTDGTLYEISAGGDGTLAVAAFRDIRDRDADFGEGMEITTVAEGVGYSGVGRLIDPTIAIDDDGNLYIVWTENGEGDRDAGIWYSYSTDRNASWADPIRVDPNANADIWPWISVGDPGQVAITYLETDTELARNNGELADDDDGWHVDVAQTQNGLGCADSPDAGFRVTRGSSEPVHFGTICQGGTVCQAQLVDRRLGDYFSIEIDGDRSAYVAVSDTRQGGAVALPLQLRQTGGPRFETPKTPPGGVPGEPPVDPPDPTEPVETACTAPADGGDAVRRVEGATRLETAVGVSADCFDEADVAVLARIDDFPDALAASGLAAAADAPVLLTPTEGLEDAVADELQRLGVSQVYLLGGEAALSAQVERDVEALDLEPTRIGGPERFATAALVADEVVAVGGPTDTAVVALGGGRTADGDWPDALAASNLAAAAGAPVLLSGPDEVPQVTTDALARTLSDGDAVFLAGGTQAVGAGPERELADGYDVTRLGGGDRYATAVAVTAEAVRLGGGVEPVVLATGTVFADALVAGPAAARLGGALLLVDPADLDDSAATRDFLAANAAQVDTAIVVGGPSTVSERVADQVLDAITE